MNNDDKSPDPVPESTRRLERRSIDALVPYARNPRTHSAAQVARIAASIREFGFNNPVLISSAGDIIAGHGRVLAARKLAMTEVPVIELDHLTPTQRRAYVLADNQLSLLADWDEQLLAVEFEELANDGFDPSLTGFDAEEIDRLLAVPTEIEETAPDQSDQLDEQYAVLVACGSESDQSRLLARLTGEGYECRALVS